MKQPIDMTDLRSVVSLICDGQVCSNIGMKMSELRTAGETDMEGAERKLLASAAIGRLAVDAGLSPEEISNAVAEHASCEPQKEDDFFNLTECHQAVHSEDEELIEGYEIGDYFTLDEFIKLCQQGMFIDYDGIGNYVNAGDGSQPDSDEQVSPSDIIAGKINRNYSHVHWYNR